MTSPTVEFARRERDELRARLLDAAEAGEPRDVLLETAARLHLVNQRVLRLERQEEADVE